MVQHIYMGQWTWRNESWTSPVAGLPFGAFDLRSRAACTSPGLSTGPGIFVYPQPVAAPGLIYLGERNANVLTPRKDAIKNMLALGENIVADTVGEMVAELYLQHAEPSWDLRWGRLRGRDWKLSCLGEVWVARQMTDAMPEWAYVLECLRANYQQVKAEVAQGRLSSDFHRRYLQSQIERYRIRNHEDVTRDSRETPLPHGTTWSETWPTVSTTISSGQDQAWTEVAADVQVTSVAGANRLGLVGVPVVNAAARCDTTLSGDNHFCQATVRFTVGDSGHWGGPSTRFAAAADTGYRGYYITIAGEEITYGKVVAGTTTNLALFDDDTPVVDTNYVMKLTSKSNDTHTLARDGVNKITNHSNADIVGNVRCGLRFNGESGQTLLHAVSAEDITAEPTGFLTFF